MKNIKLFALVLMGASAMFACSNDETLERASMEEALAVSLEAEMDAYFGEANDMAQAIDRNHRTPDNPNMRVAEQESDFRLGCATMTMDVDFTDFMNPKGSIWVDFGNGCEDENGNVRKGKIQMEYKGGDMSLDEEKMEMKVEVFMTNTFHGYEFNDIKIEGVNDVTFLIDGESMKTTHKLTNGKVTWPDGRWATRNSEINLNLTMQNMNDFHYNITGEASGMTKDGEPYAMTILEDLQHRYNCIMQGNLYPTSGIKHFTLGEKQIVLNYGDGACNKEVTLTINGVTKSHTLN